MTSLDIEIDYRQLREFPRTFLSDTIFFPLGEHNLARLPKFIRQLFHHAIPAAREISLEPNRSTIEVAVKLGLRLFSLAKEKNRSHRNRYSGCSKYGTDVRHD